MLSIETINNYLPEQEYKNLLKFFNNDVGFTYGWSSSNTVSDMVHWNINFIKNKNISAELNIKENELYLPIYNIWQKLKIGHLAGHELVRCYANAHTFGTEGAPHTDTPLTDNYTTIIYVIPEWKTEWAGETMFYNDVGQPVKAILPEPNKLFTFDGSILHCAKAVSKLFNGIRITLMFKTRFVNENA